MSGKPTYLGLLNAIALGESRGAQLLDAWAGVTPDEALRATLELVALREREHGAAFARRIAELGYRVLERDGAAFEDDLQLARSAKSDLKKFRKLLGYRRDGGSPAEDADDPLDSLFADRSIDPETGALLGRFIAEERDSERQLRAAHQRLVRARDDARSNDPDRGLDALTTRLARLNAAVAELKALRSELSRSAPRDHA